MAHNLWVVAAGRVGRVPGFQVRQGKPGLSPETSQASHTFWLVSFKPARFWA